jgi:hypothetical protein
VILLFEISKLPQRNGDEQEWADGVLSCLRNDKPDDLPDGVRVMPDFKTSQFIPLHGTNASNTIDKA